MGTAIALRTDYTSKQLRGLAARACTDWFEPRRSDARSNVAPSVLRYVWPRCQGAKSEKRGLQISGARI